MVRTFSIIGILILILASWNEPGGAESHFNILKVYMEVGKSITRNEPHMVTVTLSNSADSKHVVDYIFEKEKEEGPLDF